MEQSAFSPTHIPKTVQSGPPASRICPRSVRLERYITRYGARHYLKGLRNKREHQTLPVAEYTLQAAAAYCTAGFPRRAEALLHTLSPGTLSPEQDRKCRTLAARLSTLSTNTPSLSVTLIVRNESENICRVLDSIDTLADEIVICDTGSQDATLLLAARYGVRLVTHPWNDHFGEARSAGLAQCSGDHILWLDADDSVPARSARRIRTFLATSPRQAAAVTIRNTTAGETISFLQVRLFPRHRGMHFTGAVHEQLLPSLHAAGIVCTTCPEIQVDHQGYHSPRVTRNKLVRNLRILNHETALHGATPFRRYCRAETLLSLGNLREALDEFTAVIATPPRSGLNPEIVVQSLIHAGAILLCLDRPGMAVHHLNNALARDPARSDARLLLGKAALRAGDTCGALNAFVRAAREPMPLRTTAAGSSTIRRTACIHAVKTLRRLDRTAEARNLVAAALRVYPRDPALLELRNRLHQGPAPATIPPHPLHGRTPHDTAVMV